MPRRKNEPDLELEPETDEDLLASEEDGWREQWLNHPFTRKSLVAAKSGAGAAFTKFMEAARNSTDPKVRGAVANYDAQRGFSAFLAQGDLK